MILAGIPVFMWHQKLIAQENQTRALESAGDDEGDSDGENPDSTSE